MPVTDLNSAKALGADLARALYGLTGSGLKIGIISDSYNNLNGAATDVGTGDLPNNVTVVRDLASTGKDEGRAMIELAYRIAPDATYYFASGYSDPGSTVSSIQSCANAVDALRAAGCTIIIDDLGFGAAEAFYQVGTVLDVAIANAVAAGVNYFSAAGNDGKAFYEKGFTPLSTTIAGVNGGAAVVANDFGGGNAFLSITIANGSKLDGTFEWAQPFASIGSSGKSATNSLAIYLLDSAGTVVASATGDMVGGDPAQSLSFTNSTSSTAFRLVVVQNGGTVPTGQLFKLISSNGGITINDPNANIGSGNIYGHELITSQNSLGAVNYLKTPAFGTSPAVPTSFTSVGPGSILFDGQGNLLTTPINTNEPNFSAAQGSNTAVPGFAPFDGTSAAAPNAGAVAALALQANGSLSTAQVTALMAQSAIPISSTLADTGAGLIQARALVELAAAAGGARWTAGAGGNWTDTGSWSTGAAPTTVASALVGNNLGGFTGSYTLTANTGGLVAGSLAIGAAAGSSATLQIVAGGSLAVGGANTNNVTANDLLVSNNGTLSVAGGTLTVASSLNSNNGTATVSAGSVTADNFAQVAGSFTIGGGAQAATVTLTGGGLSQTGGSVTLSASGTLQTTAATVSSSSLLVQAGATFISSAALMLDSAVAAILAGGSLSAAAVTLATTSAAGSLNIAGLFTDSGALTAGSSASTVTVQSGGVLSIGGTASNASIALAGTGRLQLTSSNSTVLTSGYTARISGLISGQSQIDFTGLAYNAADTTSYDSTTGQFNLFDAGTGNQKAVLFLSTADNYTTFQTAADSNNNVVLRAVACYGRGTLIAVEQGEAAVEALCIGQKVRTASGALRPIRWIGRRSYLGTFAAGNTAVLPVLIRRGALADGVPRRDLTVSPLHAMLLDGVLVPAVALVNGTSIVQAGSVERVDYVHVELDTHDVLLAEGAVSESFVDDGSRGMFQNAEEYGRLYPDAVDGPAVFCAPRLEDGDQVAAIRARLAARAAGRGAVAAPGTLHGHVDTVTATRVTGWARDEAGGPVRLRVLDRGVVLTEVVADGLRPDLVAAGYGDGRHGFDCAIDGGLAPWQQHEITVVRAADGCRLDEPVRMEPVAPPARAVPSAVATGLHGRLDHATRDRINGWAQDADDAAEPVALQILVNGHLLARVVANRYRADLQQAGIGTGRHAFDVLVPGGLSPLVAQLVQVRRESDGAELQGSPVLIEAATGFDPALQGAVAQAVLALDGAEGLAVAGFLADQAERLRQGHADRAAQRAARQDQDVRRSKDGTLLRALVIDERVPLRRRDAGSHALLSHMRALRQLGYAVSFVAAGALQQRDAAEVLEAECVTWCGSPHYASIEEVLRRQAGCFDVIYLHGEAIATRYLGLARAHGGGARVLYSVADLHHLRLERQARVEACPQLLAESRGLRMREHMAAWSADAVLTHSTVEAAMLRTAVPQATVHVVPWAVAPRARVPARQGRRGVGFLGHFGHAPNRDAVLVLTETVMPLVWAVDPSIPCVIAGSDMPEGLLRTADPRIEVLGAVPEAGTLFDRVVATVAPLRFGAGVKGKVLESLAAGVPCVMSPVAAEGMALPQPLTMLVGEDAAAMAAAILLLHADAATWRAASRAGLAHIRAAHAETIVAEALRAAIGGVAREQAAA